MTVAKEEDALSSMKIMFTAMHIRSSVEKLLGTIVFHDDTDAVTYDDSSVMTLKEILKDDTDSLRRCIGIILNDIKTLDARQKREVVKFLKPLIIDDRWKKKRADMIEKANMLAKL